MASSSWNGTQEEVDTCNVLNLKDNITVIRENDNARATPQVDLPIRPYPDGSDSDRDSPSEHCFSALDTHPARSEAMVHAVGDPLEEELDDDVGILKHDGYEFVSLGVSFDHYVTPCSYTFIILSPGRGNIIFFSTVTEQDCKSADSDEETESAHQHITGGVNSNGSTKENGVKSLLSNLPMKGLNSFLKVSGKGQRWKKLSNLLGAIEFDTFDYFEPTPLSIVVMPVTRQNLGNSSGDPEDRPEGSSPPSQTLLNSGSWPPETLRGMPWSTFRQELQRLGTFDSMSPSARVFALRLAQTGLLCLPGGDVICYFCGLRWHDWDGDESPMAAHRRLRPHCPLLTGADCDNIPVGMPDAEHLRELTETWSLSGPPLFSLGEPSQQGAAAEVTGIAASASPVTDPRSSAGSPQGNPVRPPQGHPVRPIVGASDMAEDSLGVAAHSASQASGSASGQAAPAAVAPPQLPNLDVHGVSSQAAQQQQQQQQQQPQSGSAGGAQGSNAAPPAGTAAQVAINDGTAQPEVPGHVARSPPPRNDSRPGQQVVTYQQLGIMTDAPKKADMAMINSRVATYRNWPSTHSQTPLALSEAGFYYAGYADCGRCFFCGGGLKNWDPMDNPWVEHARWFAKCAYVRQCQGQDFVDIIQELNTESDRRQISLDQVREEIRRRRADGDRLHEPSVDPAIPSALEAGFRQEAIDIEVHRMQREGLPLTVDRLVDCLQAQDGSLAAEGAAALLDEDEPEDSEEAAEVAELVATNSEIRQQRTCKICLDKEVCIVFLPCGHLVCCAECSPALRNCPMCRQRIKGKVRAFPV